MVNNNKVPELSNHEFEKFVKGNLVLIDFFADWCMPCLVMAPVMEELSKKFRGKVKFAKVNVDENPELAQKFKILSIPNFVLFRDGKQIEQFIGSIPTKDFEEKLRKHL